MLWLGVVLLLLELAHVNCELELSCAERGYTLCDDVCCGRNSSSGEAACCLEANATCCNKPSLAEQSNRFFCCPPSRPVCDFEAATCRVNKSLKPADPGRKPLDIFRALTKKPRFEYRGRGVQGSSSILNIHLKRNIGSHGYLYSRKLMPCSQFQLEELHNIQQVILKHSSRSLNAVYQLSSDNRRLLHDDTAGYEEVWRQDIEVINRTDFLQSVLRDGQCYEVVMSYIHHLWHDDQKLVLDKVEALPLLPDNQYQLHPFDDQSSSADVVYVQGRYIQQVGCGACHVDKSSELDYNATHCYVEKASQCMQLGRLHCTLPSAPGNLECCPGLICAEVFIPASEVSFAMNSTRCVVDEQLTDAFDEYERSGTVGHFLTRSTRESSNHSAVQKTRELSRLPALPASWWANGTYFNLTSSYPDQPAGQVRILYQEVGVENYSSIRVDFQPVCPFKQLWKKGIDANYGPCSVIYRNNTVTYAYHGQHSCVYCEEDAVPPWHRDFLCAGGSECSSKYISLLAKNKTILTDFCQFEWWWTTFLVLRNYRNWYFHPNTSIPVRIAEDLDTGYTDIDYFQPVAFPGIDDSEIMSGIDQYNVSHVAGLHGTSPCPGPDERLSTKTGDVPECIFVQAIPLRRTWPQREWPESDNGL